MNHTGLKIATGHQQRGILFKPEVSVFFKDGTLDIPFEELHEVLDRSGEDQRTKIHVVSDGRRAYLKRV